jgi:transcriptional regulator with XRE-family HTH domain
MAQRIVPGSAAHAKRRERWEKRRRTVSKECRPRSYPYPWNDAYRVPMGDGAQGGETWGSYLRRMTERPGWSVARLARESGIARQTIFKWIAGRGGVTVASVQAIAKAVDDDPTNALRAAGQVGQTVDELDEELELVRTDDRLSPETKLRIIDLILERRERERVANMAETRRIIELMRETG